MQACLLLSHGRGRTGILLPSRTVHDRSHVEFMCLTVIDVVLVGWLERF